AAQSVFAKQAADARTLVQAGEYVRFWREELDKAEQQARQTAEAAEAASQKISNAFKTLGTRSAEELRAEIVKVRQAMDTVRATAVTTGDSLKGAFAAGEAKIKALELEIRQVSGTLTTADKAAALFANSLGQIAAGNLIADGVGFLVNKVKELAQAFLEAVVQGDQMRRGLTAVYGDARIAAQQIDFLRKSSSESGVAFGALSQEFVKFSAAMKSANIPLAESNALFKAVTAASASLGLGSEATAGALNALGQMASKGVVSLEELRAQLGDRLPGALGLAAKGLGITEAQLIKLVESGQLATRDFIVPFTAALTTMRGEVDGIVPSYDRFKGLLTETAQGAGDSGWAQVLNLAIKVLGGTVGVFAIGLSALSEALFIVVKGVAALAVAFTSPRAALELMTEAVEEARVRLTGQAEALNNLIEPTQAVTAATTQQAAAMTATTAAVVRSINANTSLDTVQKLLALSTALAGDATLSAAAKIVQYNVASAELLAAQAALTVALEKSAKAAKQQGDTLIELARLTGNAVEIQNASAMAAQLHAAALDRVTASQAAETAMLIAQKAELVDSAAKRGLTTEQIKVQIDALDKLIVKSQAETEQAKQASAAAAAALFERKLAIEVLKDHSAQIDVLRKAVEVATLTLKQYEIQAAQGKRTDEEVLKARRALTEATVLYRDALNDAIAKTKLDTDVKSANLQLSIAQVAASGKHYEALAREARALGDSSLAQYYDIEAKKAAIKVLQLKLEMDRLQNAASLIEIEMKRKLVDTSTEEGRAKLKLLDIELAMVKIKQAQSESIKDEIRAIEAEITTLRVGTNARRDNTQASRDNASARNANTGAIDAETSALERQNAAIERNNAALEKAIDLENKRQKRDKDGFSTGSDGQKIVAGSDLGTATGIFKFLQEAGVKDEAQAKSITRQFLDTQGNVPYFNNPGQIQYGGDTLSMALLKAAEKITFGAGGGGTSNGFGGGGERGQNNGPSLGGGGGGGSGFGGGGGGGQQQSNNSPSPAQTPREATNLTINLAAGVNTSSRGEVEKLARAIMPAIEGLQRRGASSGS
ncbi:MAG: tape measure protein, partial [Pseudomonadota bacterium]